MNLNGWLWGIATTAILRGSVLPYFDGSSVHERRELYLLTCVVLAVVLGVAAIERAIREGRG